MATFQLANFDVGFLFNIKYLINNDKLQNLKTILKEKNIILFVDKKDEKNILDLEMINLIDSSKIGGLNKLCYDFYGKILDKKMRITIWESKYLNQ